VAERPDCNRTDPDALACFAATTPFLGQAAFTKREVMQVRQRRDIVTFIAPCRSFCATRLDASERRKERQSQLDAPDDVGLQGLRPRLSGPAYDPPRMTQEMI
jgi:hypothetical protein